MPESSLANWWTRKVSGKTEGIVAHTPDPKKYHPVSADPRLAQLMGGSSNMVIIPRAYDDGRSMGFDQNNADVVVVDGGDKYGRYFMDPRKLTNDQILRARAMAGDAVGQGTDEEAREQTMRAFIALSKPISEVTEEDLLPDYMRQEAAKSKPAAANGVTVQPQQPVKVASAPPAPVPMPIAGTVTTTVPQPAIAPAAVGAVNLTPEQLSQLVHALNNQRGPIYVPQPPPPPPPAPSIDLADLAIPFLSPSGPQKPEVLVLAQMGKMGQLQVRYHMVVSNRDFIVLVYDMRWEAGQQWQPPVMLDEPLIITLINERQRYSVDSLGVSFNLGCFACTVLFLHGDQPKPQLPQPTVMDGIEPSIL